MDPNATYDLLLDAMREGDVEAAREHALDLLAWVRWCHDVKPIWDVMAKSVIYLFVPQP